MAIKDLKIRQGSVDIILDIVDKAPIREFNKFGKVGRVCNAKGKDESGEISITLWNDDIDKVNVGDKIHITNGYVNEWQGEPQLTTGKFGKIEVVGKSDIPVKKQEEPKPAEKTSEEESSEDLDVQEESIE